MGRAGWLATAALVCWVLGFARGVRAQDAPPTSLSVRSDQTQLEGDGEPTTWPRGTHARVEVAPLLGIAVSLGGNTAALAGGGVLGLDLAVHARHEVGLRLAYVAHDFPRRGTFEPPLLHYMSGAIVYRYHSVLTRDRVVPTFHIGGGVGYYDGGCLSDSCTSLGVHGTMSIGGELAVDPLLSWTFGVQIEGFFTLFVNPFIQPLATTGMRFG